MLNSWLHLKIFLYKIYPIGQKMGTKVGDLTILEVSQKVWGGDLFHSDV